MSTSSLSQPRSRATTTPCRGLCDGCSNLVGSSLERCTCSRTKLSYDSVIAREIPGSRPWLDRFRPVFFTFSTDPGILLLPCYTAFRPPDRFGHRNERKILAWNGLSGGTVIRLNCAGPCHRHPLCGAQFQPRGGTLSRLLVPTRKHNVILGQGGLDFSKSFAYLRVPLVLAAA